MTTGNMNSRNLEDTRSEISFREEPEDLDDSNSRPFKDSDKREILIRQIANKLTANLQGNVKEGVFEKTYQDLTNQYATYTIEDLERIASNTTQTEDMNDFSSEAAAYYTLYNINEKKGKEKEAMEYKKKHDEIVKKGAREIERSGKSKEEKIVSTQIFETNLIQQVAEHGGDANSYAKYLKGLGIFAGGVLLGVGIGALVVEGLVAAFKTKVLSGFVAREGVKCLLRYGAGEAVIVGLSPVAVGVITAISVAMSVYMIYKFFKD